MKVWAFVSVLVLCCVVFSPLSFLFFIIYPTIWFACFKTDLTTAISHKRFFYSQRKFCSISSHKVNVLHGYLAIAFYFQLSIQILQLSSLVCHKDWKKVTKRLSVSENHFAFTPVSLGTGVPLRQLTTQQKEVLRKSKNNDTNSVQVCVYTLGPVYQGPALKLTRLLPLKKIYWTPIHPSSLFLTLLCPFFSSYTLLFSLVRLLWEVS